MGSPYFEALMKQVFIVGPETGNIPQSVAAAFKQKGWEARLFTFAPLRRQHLYQIAIGLLHDPHCRKAMVRAFNDLLREQVLPHLCSRKIDFLLILKGDCLDADNRDSLIRCNVPIITWTLDSLSRAPYQKLLGEISRHIFYIDGGDVPTNDKSASWLPLGFDDTIYRPHREISKDLDILLIGKLGYRYRRREQFLRQLHNSSLVHRINCGLIGSTGVVSGNLFLYLNHSLRKKPGVVWLSRRIPAEQLACQIARAKVCINVHQDDGSMPINPMFFAIPATSTCQVAEQKPYLHQWLEPGKDYVEFKDEEFLDVLALLLSDEKKLATLSQNGYEASRFHTYANRVDSLVAVL